MADFTDIASNEDMVAIANGIRAITRTGEGMTIPQMPQRLLDIKILVPVRVVADFSTGERIYLGTYDTAIKHLFIVTPETTADLTLMTKAEAEVRLDYSDETGELYINYEAAVEGGEQVSLVVIDGLLSSTEESFGFIVNRADNLDGLRSQVQEIDEKQAEMISDLMTKAEVVSGATTDNLAKLTSTGNLADSGKKVSDLVLVADVRDNLTSTDVNKPLSANQGTNLKNLVDGKQANLGFTPENLANKDTNNGYCPLDSGGKVPLANLPSTLLKYQGVWNAATNSPTLTSPDLTKASYVYNVGTPGTQFGISWKLGDWLIYNASGVPEKSDNSDDVVSVNGQTGVVTLDTSHISDTTDKRYVTDTEKTTLGTLTGFDTTFVEDSTNLIQSGSLYDLEQLGFKQKGEISAVEITYDEWGLDLSSLPMFIGEEAIARGTDLYLLETGDFAIYKDTTAFGTDRFKLNFKGDEIPQSEATAVFSQIVDGSRLVYFLSSTASLSIQLRITDTELRISTGSSIAWNNITIISLEVLTPAGTYSYKIEDAGILASSRIEISLIDNEENKLNARNIGLYSRALQEVGAVTIYRQTVPSSDEEPLGVQYFTSQYSANVANNVAYITNLELESADIYYDEDNTVEEKIRSIDILQEGKVDKAYATDYVYTEGLVFTWAVDHYTVGTNQISVSRNAYPSGSADKLVIPKYYDDGTHGIALVTEIGENAFGTYEVVEKIVLPDSINTIRASAFSYCHSLLYITLPRSVVRIDNYAFTGCTSLKSIEIPDAAMVLNSAYIFWQCINLVDVKLKGTTIPLPVAMFRACTNLTSITIPKGVVHVGEAAFFGCSRLTKIYIEEPVPPIVSSDAFTASGITTSAGAIYVPYESLTAYKTATNWSTYADRIFAMPDGEDLTSKFALKEALTNKVISISSSSTDDQYPTAKCVYDIIGDVESLLAEV